MDNLIEALVLEPAKEFTKHLSEPFNEKIIFSGKFGKGKTTFLLHFFENQTKYLGGEHYYAYFIDPVNYTVASNEDIFKYLKYDILLALLENGKKADDIEFSNFEIATNFIAENPSEVIKALLRYIPQVGKQLEALVNHLEPLFYKMKEFKKQREGATESNRAFAFLKSIENNNYSIYENDIITQLIRELLKSTVERGEGEVEKPEKQNVLVIDNLDRIDPEHIFRILNIFSAHIDYRIDRMQTNKFGFDKVIIVCDIKNIRNIFHKKYGSGVDFSGYIDKFYSIDIFHFQNYTQIAKTVHSILNRLQIGYSRNQTGKLSEVVLDHGIFNIVTVLVNANLLGLREVFNFCKAPFIIDKNVINVGDDIGETRESIPLWNTPILEMAILSKMLGGAQELLKAMMFLQTEDIYIYNYSWHANLMIFFDLRYIHKFRSLEQMTYKLPLQNVLVSIQMDRTKPSKIDLINADIASASPVYYQPTIHDFYFAYLKVLRDLHKRKYLE